MPPYDGYVAKTGWLPWKLLACPQRLVALVVGVSTVMSKGVAAEGKVHKQGSVRPKSRFMSNDFAAKRQRYHREYWRKRNQERTWKNPSGSGHKLYPCCGKRRAQCRCTWDVVESHADSEEVAQYLDNVRKAQLLKAGDTMDCRHFFATPGIQELDLLSFMRSCIVFRRFNRPRTWDMLCATNVFPVGARPKWHALERVLRQLFVEGPVFGGVFYPAVLNQWRVPGTSSWKSARSMDSAARERLSLQVLLDCIPKQAVACYEANPSTETFAAVCDQFMSAVQGSTKGVFSWYSWKVVLDLLNVSGRVPDHHIGSSWPTACPGYRLTMNRLFPCLPKQHWLTAFHWLHRQLSPRHGSLCLAETCMQLCWDHRRLAGQNVP